MRIRKVDHLGIAIRDLDEAEAFFGGVLGLDLTHRETVEDQGVTTHFYPLPGVKLELLESIDPDGPIARYLERHGPGIHHLALEVPDIHEAITHMQEQGIRMVDEEPRDGVEGSRIAFCHPKDTQGVLLELVELPRDAAEELDVLGA